MFLEQILQPFSYLRIKEVRGKALYDLVIPILLTVASVILVQNSNIPASDVNLKVIDAIAGFVANLPGFYIAALAGVATFNSKVLEDFMETTSECKPFINVKVIHNNNRTTKHITIKRRFYLSSLFAYLTAVSFLIVVINKLSPLFLSIFDKLQLPYTVLFFFLFWQLVVITFCGLYYLGQRMHTD